MPLVSVVIPCLNAERTIATCLASLVDSHYPKDRLEVLVVDGCSTDRTRQIVLDYSRQYPFIRLLDNIKQTQQFALNVGIGAASGAAIIRMDAHCGFEPSYISEAQRHLFESGADAIGGRLITQPRENTPLGRAIAAALSTRFGVGDSAFRVAQDDDGSARWVDTVPWPCYRRDVFDRVGLFNENLARSEDLEFHGRMKTHGCRTLFVPSLVNHYYARSDFRAFVAHSFDNGRWTILPARYTGFLVVSARHLVPLGFVGTIIGLMVASAVAPSSRWIMAALLSAYAVACAIASLQVARARRDPVLGLYLPWVFATLHSAYGLGSLFAAAEVVISRAAAKRRGQ